MTNKEKAQFILDVLSIYDSGSEYNSEWSEEYKEQIKEYVDDMRVNYKFLFVLPITDEELDNTVKLLFLEEILDNNYER